MNFAVISILFMCILHHNECQSTEKYTNKYDNIDLNEILSSEHLLTGYLNCLLGKGPCTPDGKELKTYLPDAIANDCKDCTDRQRVGADQVMHYLIDNRPDDWDMLEEKFQSDGSYKKEYLERKRMSE